jgi:large subunit ribosomal protein L9
MTTKQRFQIPKGKHGGMQLVLTEDVPNLGKQGDVVEVKGGYGRNYLLPRGLATVPTAHNLRLLERFKIQVQKAREARIADLRALAEQLQKMSDIITIEANANEEGHLYGSVGSPEISKALRGRGYPVDAEMVKLEGAVKEVGVYEIKLNLGYEIDTAVKVGVIPAKTPEKK